MKKTGEFNADLLLFQNLLRQTGVIKLLLLSISRSGVGRGSGGFRGTARVLRVGAWRERCVWGKVAERWPEKGQLWVDLLLQCHRQGRRIGEEKAGIRSQWCFTVNFMAWLLQLLVQGHLRKGMHENALWWATIAEIRGGHHLCSSCRF